MLFVCITQKVGIFKLLLRKCHYINYYCYHPSLTYIHSGKQASRLYTNHKCADSPNSQTGYGPHFKAYIINLFHGQKTASYFQTLGRRLGDAIHLP